MISVLLVLWVLWKGRGMWTDREDSNGETLIQLVGRHDCVRNAFVISVLWKVRRRWRMERVGGADREDMGNVGKWGGTNSTRGKARLCEKYVCDFRFVWVLWKGRWS